MSISLTGLSGEGHSPLDVSTNVAVQYITAFVTTIPARARRIGDGTLPLGLRDIGEVGIGWFPDDPSGVDPPQMTEGFFIHLANETKRIVNDQGGATFFGSCWWRLAPGVVIDLVVEW